MMKYRGPRDQHTIIERKYIIRLVVGLAIIVAGVAITAYVATASQSTILAPNPDDPGAGMVEVNAPVSRNPAVGIVLLLVGVIVNFYAVSQYRSEYSEIREKEPRPEGTFLGFGVLVTLLALALGVYTIFVLTA